MTTTTKGASRAASARASRAGSIARDIIKRRDKPYKTEKQRVLARKRKLDLHTSYAKPALGYTFLAVGTPDLAERCKELSRQRGFAVNVVNAKPVSKHAHDPDKVSHHIHRIGYHFKSEIIEEACGQLGYMIHRGHFIKEEDLRKQHQESSLAQVLAKYSMDPHLAKGQQPRESPDKVRAAIKELFPKIPDQDLNEIVHHAWEEGAQRVGTMAHLELPRRVQLATIARIRHTYTDYDRLLRAFEWKEARSMVEPECLQKLIQWRGEKDEGDDNELEEIVRETIVIDSDDDEAVGNVSEADDEDSVTEIEPGNTSDTSIEITHYVAADGDFGAESGIDQRHKRLVDRYRPRQPDVGQRNTIAKQKIGAARQRLRAGPPPPTCSMPPVRQSFAPAANQDVISRAQVQPDQHGQYPQEVFINGQRLRLASMQPAQADPRAYQQLLTPQTGAYGQYPTINRKTAPSLPYPYRDEQGGPAAHDRPIASIEEDNARSRPAPMPHSTNGFHPPTSENGRSQKTRAMDHLKAAPSSGRDEYRPVYADRRISPQNGRAVQALPAGVEVIDLTSPRRLGHGVRPTPYIIREPATAPLRPDERDQLVEHGSLRTALHDRPPAGYAEAPQVGYQHAEPALYDRRQPPPMSEQYMQPQPAAMGMQTFRQSYGEASPKVVHQYAEAYTEPNGQPYLQPRVYQQAFYPPQQYSPYVRQPVHGEPAPVQQVHMEIPTGGLQYGHQGRHSELQRRQYIPADGGIAPTQYYYPR